MGVDVAVTAAVAVVTTTDVAAGATADVAVAAIAAAETTAVVAVAATVAAAVVVEITGKSGAPTRPVTARASATATGPDTMTQPAAEVSRLRIRRPTGGCGCNGLIHQWTAGRGLWPLFSVRNDPPARQIAVWNSPRDSLQAIAECGSPTDVLLSFNGHALKKAPSLYYLYLTSLAMLLYSDN